MAREAKQTRDRARQITVAVVGAGRLGSALALALDACGYRVNALVARRRRHVLAVAQLFARPHPVALAATQLASLPPADLLIISTTDDQITATAARLARSTQSTAHTTGRSRIALHTSGALSSDALAPLRAAGFAVGSLHPLVSISTDARTGAQSLRGAFYCVEGDRRATNAARKLVRALAGRSLSISPADKALYHAAAVLAAGHTVALFDLAAELLVRCGIARRAARRALLPLTQSTLHNLRATAPVPARALTGPFARGDAATVRKHLAALMALDDRAMLEIYALLGLHALQLAAALDAGPAAARREIATALTRVIDR